VTNASLMYIYCTLHQVVGNNGDSVVVMDIFSVSAPNLFGLEFRRLHVNHVKDGTVLTMGSEPAFLMLVSISIRTSCH
jgi:hypothetical protein